MAIKKKLLCLFCVDYSIVSRKEPQKNHLGATEGSTAGSKMRNMKFCHPKTAFFGIFFVKRSPQSEKCDSTEEKRSSFH